MTGPIVSRAAIARNAAAAAALHKAGQAVPNPYTESVEPEHHAVWMACFERSLVAEVEEAEASA